jgi:hypothetical protein
MARVAARGRNRRASREARTRCKCCRPTSCPVATSVHPCASSILIATTGASATLSNRTPVPLPSLSPLPSSSLPAGVPGTGSGRSHAQVARCDEAPDKTSRYAWPSSASHSVALSCASSDTASMRGSCMRQLMQQPYRSGPSSTCQRPGSRVPPVILSDARVRGAAQQGGVTHHSPRRDELPRRHARSIDLDSGRRAAHGWTTSGPALRARGWCREAGSGEQVAAFAFAFVSATSARPISERGRGKNHCRRPQPRPPTRTTCCYHTCARCPQADPQLASPIGIIAKLRTEQPVANGFGSGGVWCGG